ncbi:hypothetical protein EXIGLDRAFT_642644 [Exidia glandulosa HHB12029]|uniref:Deoxycytidylate deaminase n=1 Tax=Exidia glandulosa HHB12029 TaxID=1314781 RepID=A0A166B0Y9_EXIGL|nr:hypothetical protein EXIGLDRAFT_642644 [Exidia glandulosa HHB12029]
MLIIITGPRGAGKSTIEDYLARQKGFRVLQFVEGGDKSLENENTPVGGDPVSGDTQPSTPIETERNEYLDGRGSSRRLGKTDSLASTSTIASVATTASSGSQPQVQALQMYSLPYMLDYVTRNWQTDFVTMKLDGTRPEVLAEFARRPFCAILHVDAPIMVRWERTRQKSRKNKESVPKLEEFIEEHDQLVFGAQPLSAPAPARDPTLFYENAPLPPLPVALPPASPAPLRIKTFVTLNPSLNASSHLVTLRVSNSFKTKQALYDHLDRLDIVRPDRLRPTWDDYFMTLAELAARRSNCMKRRVGAILVRGRRIVATGYNGTARGLKNCNEGGCNACNLRRIPGEEKLNECICLHAEENALLEAGRDRVSGWGDEATTLYCNTCPCLRCSVKIVQTGVKEVVYNHSYKVDEASAKLFEEAGVVLRRHTPPPSVHQ